MATEELVDDMREVHIHAAPLPELQKDVVRAPPMNHLAPVYV